MAMLRAECTMHSNILSHLVFMNVGSTYILRPVLGLLHTYRGNMPSHQLASQ